MSIQTDANMNGDYSKVSKFNPEWNPHYDFTNEKNLAEIEKVESYDRAFEAGASDADEYQIGKVINSPWGSNQVISHETKDGVDTTIKEIVVDPGFMLSLQRHRGRAEIWEVEEGTLTVISNGEVFEVKAGEKIELPKGSVHCMINRHDEPVKVRETQTGINREADNVRLVDFNNRPTYPLTTEIEFKSALLYAQIQMEIAQKFQNNNEPNPALLPKVA